MKPETTPTETERWSASGSPIAIAHWPACTLRAVGELDRRRQLRVVVDLHQREVGAGFEEKRWPATRSPFANTTVILLVPLRHDVGVGDDQAVARVDEARARRALDDALALVRRLPPPKNCENGSVGTSCVPLTVTCSATTDGSTRLTALMMRSWSVVPGAARAAALNGGAACSGAGDVPRSAVLAKSIIEKLPMIAPISPTTAVPKMLVRDFTMFRAPYRGGTDRDYPALSPVVAVRSGFSRIFNLRAVGGRLRRRRCGRRGRG